METIIANDEPSVTRLREILKDKTWTFNIIPPSAAYDIFGKLSSSVRTVTDLTLDMSIRKIKISYIRVDIKKENGGYYYAPLGAKAIWDEQGKKLSLEVSFELSLEVASGWTHEYKLAT